MRLLDEENIDEENCVGSLRLPDEENCAGSRESRISGRTESDSSVVQTLSDDTPDEPPDSIAEH